MKTPLWLPLMLGAVAVFAVQNLAATEAPPPPTGLAAKSGGDQTVELSWTAAPDATSYLIFASTTQNDTGARQLAADVTGTTFTATRLRNDATYYFRVKSVSPGGTSGFSEEVSATTRITRQALPDGIYTLAPRSAPDLRLQTISGSAAAVAPSTAAIAEQWTLTNVALGTVRLSPVESRGHALGAVGEGVALSGHSDGGEQLWSIIPVGGQFRLQAPGGGDRALAMIGDAREPQVVLAAKEDSRAQLWLILPVTPSAPDPGTAFVPPGYKLVFRDEFAGSEIDRTTWETLAPFSQAHLNDEIECYQAEAVHVRDGTCILRAEEMPTNCGGRHTWRSGAITTLVTYTHGYFEARLRVPQGQGFWPAFWLTSSKRWPPEWDIVEIPNMVGTLYQYMHPTKAAELTWVEGAEGNDSTYPAAEGMPNPYTGFVIYGCEVTPEAVKMWVNGRLTAHWRVSADTTDPMWVALNHAVGGKWPGPPDETTPRVGDMVIDYVRVYQPVDSEPPTSRTLSRAELTDRIRGAWAGQMIGVTYGAPTEFHALGRTFDEEIKPAGLENAIQQDDLYVEMTFAHVMDTLGLEATTEQYGEAFRDSKYELWHANAAARRNLNRGIRAPLSGHPRYNLHSDDIDFQIESDFIGIMCPGLPASANAFAERVGRVMNHGDGLYGGMFVSGMYAAAFFEGNMRRIVEAGLAAIPAESQYAAIIRDVLAWSIQHPDDWRATWQRVEAKWNRDDICPDGFAQPFNIDAKLNGAYIAIGLIYGAGDWAKTLEISTRCGQDSDCNPSSAAGILGAVQGYAGIPPRYLAEFPQFADTKFAFTNYSFNEIVASSERRTLAVVTRAGGVVTDDHVTIPLQKPPPPPLETSGYGKPVRLIPTDDAAWTWQGDWQVQTVDGWTGQRVDRIAHGAGCEATLTFTGTGLGLVGELTTDGGRAEVYVDGKKSDLLADAYIVPNTHDNDLWRIRGLAPGEHAVRIVTIDDADPRSSGRTMRISHAIVFILQ